MKCIHLSDLHLGKRVNGFSMLDDQRDILEKILSIVDSERPQAVLIAGDVYDKPVPPAEAVELFDDFLVRLSRMEAEVFVISGNHDSPERIAFGGRLMEARGVHMSPVYDGTVTPVVLEDTWGQTAFYMLPFVKPAHVRRAFPEETIESYTDAIRTAVTHMAPDPARRNVLVTHQFVTGAERCESEELSVGGADNVDASVFAPFDYVALGHLHGPQRVGSDTIRYCGTPLKYSFSEKDHIKSVTVVELEEKGTVHVRTLPLTPLHDLRQIRGSYEELTLRENYLGTAVEDYLHVVLTDEEDVPGAIGRLRSVYPNIMKLDYDNLRTRSAGVSLAQEPTSHKSEEDWFAALYEAQNGQPMGEKQAAFCEALLEKIREGAR